MPKLTVIYGGDTKIVEVEKDSLLGDGIAATGMPLEQPCAGRGTCGKCKVLIEDGITDPDEIEAKYLSDGEIAIGNRLACRVTVTEDTKIVLSPIVVYSNKAFKASSRYRRETEVPLGLAIDFGTTTVAAFLTMLDDGEVCAGAASLNQQTVFGADVISRMDNARTPENTERIHRLALASINQSVDALKLSKRIRERIERVTIVGNVAMHHLMTKQSVEKLRVYPFQPVDAGSIHDGKKIMGGIFPEKINVKFPPLIGGFVGSDALACLAYFGFDNPPGPIAAVDLGTNGEVMVTDGVSRSGRILTASTAAGPAFEGVQISCGSRAIDGAVVSVKIAEGEFIYETIGDEPPIGLTGSGLLSIVHEFRQVGLILANGRINKNVAAPYDQYIGVAEDGIRYIRLTLDDEIRLTQWDIRELQKAKGAILAAINILMIELDLRPEDLKRLILTGSFGGQVDIDAVIAIGMIPPVDRSVVETLANGAGFGAAMFLSDDGFALGEKLAAKAEQIDLDLNMDFQNQYIDALALDEIS
jgi:uncharacterized 2Fe-2S/4Fe-4S cluster protein (DUF4445 family)